MKKKVTHKNIHREIHQGDQAVSHTGCKDQKTLNYVLDTLELLTDLEIEQAVREATNQTLNTTTIIQQSNDVGTLKRL